VARLREPGFLYLIEKTKVWFCSDQPGLQQAADSTAMSG
jgi:hypothetical protein